MKKIKILFTIPNFDTAGSGKALLNIANGLNPEAFEAHIMCLHNKGTFYKVVENSGLHIHIYNFTSPARPLMRMIKECWRISRKFKEIAPNVIHSYHYGPDYTEAIAARMAGIPWVFTKKNMNWGGKSKNAWKLRSFLAKKIAVQNSDMLSKFYKESNKAILIPRGVDVMYFQSLALHGNFYNKSELEHDRRFLICVANIVPIKGIETLVQAFYKLHDKFPFWNLLLVGDDTNSYGNELKKLVKELRLSQRVNFTGKQQDVRSFLNRAEIFVLPTKEKGEGSPVALLEAMANGKIVLGSNIPGIRDQLEKFPNSLFDASNIDELSLKLEYYMGKSQEELKMLGNSFYQHVNSEYPIEKEIERHGNLYKSIVRK
ncbi:glycosyltransferase [Aequorivita todarodis]|uniref:glycosyltransferase n=1 Tax=Aequorivita todarodis TaxID=2036821 RepID=UPI00235001CD|nr:glycosyltransferase [Aequorivita todarodis]MDC8000091.1 glycosyltransferase [Aequorivita todarodis]